MYCPLNPNQILINGFSGLQIGAGAHVANLGQEDTIKKSNQSRYRLIYVWTIFVSPLIEAFRKP